MCTRDLLDIYPLSPWTCGPWDIRQIPHAHVTYHVSENAEHGVCSFYQQSFTIYLYETVCIFVCNYLPLVDSQERHDVLSALDEEQQEVENYFSYLSNRLMS